MVTQAGRDSLVVERWSPGSLHLEIIGEKTARRGFFTNQSFCKCFDFMKELTEKIDRTFHFSLYLKMTVYFFDIYFMVENVF